MKIERLQGAWEVRAGIVPGKGEAEFHRRWCYTAAECEADRAKPPDQTTKFCELRDEAYAYAKELMNPARLNWVEVTWIWF